MGGSILAAEIFEDSFDFVVQDYSLPKLKNKKKAVVFCFSYSGNTEETLFCAKQAKKNGWKTFGFGRGGKLKKAVDEFYETPDFKLPRFAVPYFLGLIQGLFAGSKKPGLTKKINRINLNVNLVRRRAKLLAKQLRGKKILIYAPESLGPITHFWEVNFDESSKTPSFIGELPDIDHHDIASFSGARSAKDFFAIFFDDGGAIKKRTRLTAQVFKKQLKINSTVLKLSPKKNISEILNNLLFGYLTSLELARFYRINPFSNSLQERLKQKLSRKK